MKIVYLSTYLFAVAFEGGVEYVEEEHEVLLRCLFEQKRDDGQQVVGAD